MCSVRSNLIRVTAPASQLQTSVISEERDENRALRIFSMGKGPFVASGYADIRILSYPADRLIGRNGVQRTNGYTHPDTPSNAKHGYATTALNPNIYAGYATQPPQHTRLVAAEKRSTYRSSSRLDTAAATARLEEMASFNCYAVTSVTVISGCYGCSLPTAKRDPRQPCRARWPTAHDSRHGAYNSRFCLGHSSNGRSISVTPCLGRGTVRGLGPLWEGRHDLRNPRPGSRRSLRRTSDLRHRLNLNHRSACYGCLLRLGRGRMERLPGRK